MNPLILCLLLMFVPIFAGAHPVPAIPIRAYFQEDDSVTFRVEIETRAFEENPDQVQYVYFKDFLNFSERQRHELKSKARDYVRDRFDLIFEPGGEIEPDFKFEFTTWNNEPLRGAYDYVMLTGTWTTEVPEGSTGYKVKAGDKDQFVVESYQFWRDQPLERWAALWPNEMSFVRDLAKLREAEVATEVETHDFGPVVVSYLRAGLVSVFSWPGAELIIFALLLMLLVQEWKPRAIQAVAFLGAIALMLSLGSLGMLRFPVSLLAFLMGAGVLVIALDNIFRPGFTSWRILLVTLFGLVHGAVLARLLGDFRLVGDEAATGLIGFVGGIAAGLLAIFLVSWAITFWVRKPVFRRMIAVPGSIVLAVAGVVFLVV